jgi:hypothetical protein
VGGAEFAGWIKQQADLYQPIAQYMPPYSTTYSPDPQRRAG